MTTDKPKYFPPVAGCRYFEGTHMQFPWPISEPLNIAFRDSRFFVVRIDPYLVYGHDCGWKVHAVVNSYDHGPTHGFPIKKGDQPISLPGHEKHCKTLAEARKAQLILQRLTPILDPTIHISDSWPPTEEEFEEWRRASKLRQPLPGRIDGPILPDSVHQIFQGQQAEEVKEKSEGHLLVPHMGNLVITEATCWQWGWRLVQHQLTPNDYLAYLERKQPKSGLPWAIVTFDYPMRLTGHIMEQRTSPEDIGIRPQSSSNCIPDQTLTIEIQSKDALDRNRDKSPLFDYLWRYYLKDRKSDHMWICLPKKGSAFHNAKGLQELEEKDESLIQRFAIERDTGIARIHQGR